MKHWLFAILIASVVPAACSATSQPPEPAPARKRAFDFSAEPAQSATEASGSAAPATSSAAVLLSKESVREVIRGRYAEIRACYEKELTKKPNLHGKVVARFMIAEDGSVASVDMDSSKLPSAPAVACIGEIFKTMQFPAPPNGMILITYPIDLMPEVTTEWQ